jgi:3-oxoacyl-[acyl-carrier-protein] synthase-3
MNKGIRAKIVGVGNYYPQKVLTNHDLEKMVDTSDEWITTRTGIKERRIAAENETTSDMAAKAAKRALKNAGIEAHEIELIILATVTPDMNFPPTACFLQQKIKANNAAAVDISAACSGFPYALSMAQAYVQTGQYKTIMIVAADKLSSITDWQDRNTCVLFGDGAGACIIKPTTSKNGILSLYLGSDGRQSDLLYIPGGGSANPITHQMIDERLHYVKMRGSELFKIAIKKMVLSAEKALERSGMTIKDIDMLVPHQANIRIIKAVGKRLELNDDQVYTNLEKHGNLSAASTITALNDAVLKQAVKKDDIIVLSAFGGGLTWGGAVIRW